MTTHDKKENPIDAKVERTWEQVADEYTRRNPHDPISRAMVWKIGQEALAKLQRKLKGEA